MIPELPNTGERLLTDEQGSWVLEHLHRYALVTSLSKGKIVLDIACGEGYGSNILAEAADRVIGVDISEEAVRHAEAKYKRDNLEFLQGSVDRIPLEDSSVDLVASFETLEHHDLHVEMIREIKRVLRPGGLLVISTPDKLNFTDLSQTSNPFHVRELYLEEFRSLLRGNFRNAEMLHQKLVYGSTIAPESNVSGFREYRGSFDHIDVSKKLERHLYNICLASDGELPETGCSTFDGSDRLEQYINGRERLYSGSMSYRLGRTLTWPIRKLFRK
jgi:2-polyprenyl-3-methyl-5-hydroxy-6-metoxy-1,4-benzoquinol methylase